MNPICGMSPPFLAGRWTTQVGDSIEKERKNQLSNLEVQECSEGILYTPL